MIRELDKQYIANTYNRYYPVLVRGKGSLCWDEDGREYIDLAAGIAVNTFGWCDDAWTQAVARQASTLQHASNLYGTVPCVQLAQMLCQKTGMRKVFFSNSGAESNECAIKAARKYAAQKKGGDCFAILTLANSFHGRTLATLAATGQEAFHADFRPLTPGFFHVTPGDIPGLLAAVEAHNPAAIMAEMVQGEGGVVPLAPEFVRAIAAVCRERDILFIADEVQTGNGRTGALYGYMRYGVQPDIVSTAKGLAGGLPLGATLLGEKVQDVLGPGSHGSTFGGNPVCCAAALSVLSRLDDALLAQVREKSDYITAQLSGAEGVLGVSGMGLMLGVETQKSADDVVSACMEQGVLVIKAKNKVRLLPALNIPWEQLRQAVGVLKACCA